jgi:hypothetical protein
MDLAAADAERLPYSESAVAELAGVLLPRLAVAAGEDPFPLLFAALRTGESDQ